MGKYGFKALLVPFNRLTRLIFNVFMSTRTLYRSLHAANLSQKYLIQDISLPSENTIKFLNYCSNNLKIYPLWLCPLKPEQKSKFSPNYISTGMVINVGIWGELKKGDDATKTNRKLEDVVRQFGGRKILYAHAYYQLDEFWQIYDQSWYENLREKYAAKVTFPTIYEKVRVQEKYKGSIIKGYINFLKSPFKIPLSK